MAELGVMVALEVKVGPEAAVKVVQMVKAEVVARARSSPGTPPALTSIPDRPREAHGAATFGS
jgi:hypothetical protein